MMKLDPHCPIGVFDSGLGGISVLRQLIAAMPGEDYVFFGDRQNAPYGSRSPEEVLRLTENAYQILREKGCKAMVIACNTATGVAADQLRKHHPEFPIIAIEPALKPAVKAYPGGKILLIATPLAVKTERIRTLVARFREQAQIRALPCPGLVELIEAGHLDDPPLKTQLATLFQAIPKPDAVVLGCTHYPHIAPAIREYFGQKVTLFDGGEGTARQTHSVLEKRNLLRENSTQGTVEFLFSLGDDRTLSLAKRLLQ